MADTLRADNDPSSRGRRTIESRRLELTCTIFFVLACAAVFRFTADDAFIVQRYAMQFARGHGLVFNIGERVSALTSPLHALILIGLTLTSPWAMEAYKVVGALAALVTMLYAGRQLFADGWERALFFSATLASPFVVMWSVGGLETPLLLSCVTLVAVLAMRARTQPVSTPGSFVFFLLSALAFLTRYDSAVFVAPLAVGVLARHWRTSIPGLIAGAIVASAWLLFAGLYYGDIFPTSFYLKALGPGHSILGGLGYELSFAVFCLLPFLVVRRPGIHDLPKEAWASTVLFSIAAALLGTVHMMFGFRFYVPMLPALLAFYMRVTRPLTRIGRWGFVPPLVSNLILWIVVYTHTLNPTLFLPSLLAPHYGFLSRLEKRGLSYEYTQLPAPTYGDFIDALRGTGRAIRADAEVRGISRSASLATIIAGATTVEIPELYVYDNLVGVRRNCPTLQRSEMYRAADYSQFIVPRFGPVERQLGSLTSTLVRVSDIAFEFDGRTEHLIAYFNPTAAHTPMPARLHDPCPPGR
jgi:arabinofuranosyltransferase